MQSIRNVTAAFAALPFAISYALATPSLSGAYMATETDFCQIQASVDSGTGQITIPKSKTGEADVLVSTETFNSGAGTWSASGWGSSESAIFEKFSDGSHGGYHAKDYDISNGGTYSNTNTTVTFNSNGGVTSVYNIVYGPVTNGIAQSFTAMYQNTNLYGKTCLDSIVAQHQ